eukprot:gene3028-10663_t
MGTPDLDCPSNTRLRVVELTRDMCELLSFDRWFAWCSEIADPRDPDATVTLPWARDDAAVVRPFLHHCHCHPVGPGEVAGECTVKGCRTPHSRCRSWDLVLWTDELFNDRSAPGVVWRGEFEGPPLEYCLPGELNLAPKQADAAGMATSTRGIRILMCRTCNDRLSKGLMPPAAVANFSWGEIGNFPPEVRDLNDVEHMMGMLVHTRSILVRCETKKIRKATAHLAMRGNCIVLNANTQHVKRIVGMLPDDRFVHDPPL